MLQPSLILIVHWLIISFCCFCAWALMGLFLWSLWLAVRDGTKHLKRLHQVPCDRCAFFTGDYRLKCTVHPSRALSEEAIDCPDYQLATHPTTAYQRPCK